MNEAEELIQQFRNLNINQQQLIRDIVQELTSANEDTDVNNTNQQDRDHTPRNTRIPRNDFVSSDGTPLAIGDKVQILSTRKTGRHGDTATVVKFNKKYVAVELDRNNSLTQRDSKYLRYIS